MNQLFVKEVCFCDDCNDEARYFQLTFKGWQNLCDRCQYIHGTNETTEQLIVVEEVDFEEEQNQREFEAEMEAIQFADFNV